MSDRSKRNRRAPGSPKHLTAYAERLLNEAFDAIRTRLSAEMTERDHSICEASRAMGFPGTNALFRITRNGVDDDYANSTRLETLASVLAYCGIGWGDLGRSEPSRWSDVEVAIRALPDLDETSLETVLAVSRAAYLGMRVRRKSS